MRDRKASPLRTAIRDGKIPFLALRQTGQMDFHARCPGEAARRGFDRKDIGKIDVVQRMALYGRDQAQLRGLVEQGHGGTKDGVAACGEGQHVGLPGGGGKGLQLVSLGNEVFEVPFLPGVFLAQGDPGQRRRHEGLELGNQLFLMGFVIEGPGLVADHRARDKESHDDE